MGHLANKNEFKLTLGVSKEKSQDLRIEEIERLLKEDMGDKFRLVRHTCE